jgi:hypothetical protein
VALGGVDRQTAPSGDRDSDEHCPMNELRACHVSNGLSLNMIISFLEPRLRQGITFGNCASV